MTTYKNTLTIIPLTNEERHNLYDPLDKGLEWFNQHFPNQECLEQLSPLFTEAPEKLLSEYTTRFLSETELKGKHHPIIEYEREMLAKCVRQGGKSTWAKARLIFEKYYLLPKRVTFGEVSKMGLDVLQRMIKSRLQLVAPPPRIREYFLENTAFGLPFGGKKNVEHHHAQGPLSGWYKPQPILPNTRFQRGKLRGIFAASAFDCDAIGPDLANVREWLKREFPHVFGAWDNPMHYTWRDIGDAVLSGKWALETDFQAMDQHFTLAVCRKLILPIYQLLLDPADYLHFAAFVEEAFSQPLLCGNNLWTGEHTLFSGLPFTNDFETLYDVVVYLGAHVLADQPVDTFGRVFKACGDDVVYFGDKATVDTVYKLVATEFKANGVILSEEKTRQQQGECRFCRHVYYPGCSRVDDGTGRFIMRPAYPAVLAVNNCLEPEVTAATRSQEILNVCRRMDDCIGHYHFNNITTWLITRMSKQVLAPLGDGAAQQFDQLQRKDWWYKVYHTVYSLGESAAFAIFENLTRSR